LLNLHLSWTLSVTITLDPYLNVYLLYLCILVSASAFFAISLALPSVLLGIVFDFNSLGST